MSNDPNHLTHCRDPKKKELTRKRFHADFLQTRLNRKVQPSNETN